MAKNRDSVEMGNGALIIDIPEEKGIELILPLEEYGYYNRFFMEDKLAEEMISIIQNKLNSRFVIPRKKKQSKSI